MSKKENDKEIFSEFEANTKNDWLKAVENSLKKSPDNSLFWDTSQGFSIGAYFTKNELTPSIYLADFQTYKAIGLKQSKKWQYREVVAVKSEKPEHASQDAMTALTSGADGVIFDLDELDIENFDLKFLLKNIQLTQKSLSFRCQKKISNVYKGLSQHLVKENIKPSDVYGTLYVDPLARWCLSGQSFENDLEELADCFNKTGELPGIKLLSVRSDHFHAAGANQVQELAFMLNATVAYLDHFTNLGIDIKQIARKIEFSVAVGSSYFLEIAKLRALKLLFSKIVQAYGETSLSVADVAIHAISASRSKIIKEPYTNMVRNTAEAMAAILGGCNSMHLLPFDEGYENSGPFAQRISRNVSLLLREEAHFEKVNDPVAGSYYVSQLTEKLSEQAWQLFLKVEEMGGFIDAFKTGFIQQEIEQSAKEWLADLEMGKRVRIGLNKYESGENYPELGKTKSQQVIDVGKPKYPLLTPLIIEKKQ